MGIAMRPSLLIGSAVLLLSSLAAVYAAVILYKTSHVFWHEYPNHQLLVTTCYEDDGIEVITSISCGHPSDAAPIESEGLAIWTSGRLHRLRDMTSEDAVSTGASE